MTKLLSRRTLLAGMAYSGVALSLNGCCTFRRCVLPLDCRPGQTSAGGVVDTHCHIFNGSDLQVAGFLAGPFANDYPEFEGLIRAAVPWVKWMSDNLAPDARKEHKRLDGIQNFFPGDAAKLKQEIQQDKAIAHQQFGEKLMAELASESDFKIELKAAIGRQDIAITAMAPEARGLLNKAEMSGIAAYNGAMQMDAAIGINIFGYLSRYLYYRYINAIELIATYGCDEKNNVQTFVAALVDFDFPLAGGVETRTKLVDQVDLMSRISVLTNGRMKFLVPFCPFKEAASSKKTSSTLVNYALGKEGFVGTKIYPPMGFYPYGNEKFGVSDGKRLDEEMARLFKICMDKNVPVMAHSSPSLCVSAGLPCVTPGPVGWEEALQFVYAKYGKPLRVSLGHFGDFPANKAGWTDRFLQLMSQPAGAALYADLSYLEEVLVAGGERAVVAALTTLVQAYPDVAPDRLMYGSDWLMLSIEKDWESYYKKIRSVLAQVETNTGMRGLADRILTQNAMSWLPVGTGR